MYFCVFCGGVVVLLLCSGPHPHPSVIDCNKWDGCHMPLSCDSLFPQMYPRGRPTSLPCWSDRRPMDSSNQVKGVELYYLNHTCTYCALLVEAGHWSLPVMNIGKDLKNVKYIKYNTKMCVIWCADGNNVRKITFFFSWLSYSHILPAASSWCCERTSSSKLLNKKKKITLLNGGINPLQKV